MSDGPFTFPPPPLMTPEQAQDLVRDYKAMADHLSAAGVHLDAARMERDSQWWLTYSIALAQTK